MKHAQTIAAAVLALLLFHCHAPAATRTFRGKVIAVADGDTFTVLAEGNVRVKVRIFGIDAPESGQAFGSVSRKWLSGRIFGKTVTLEEHSPDRYGRSLSKVWLDGEDVGLESIKGGMAWHYAHFYDSREYATAMEAAREARAGLWADPSPVNPYEWRKARKD